MLIVDAAVPETPISISASGSTLKMLLMPGGRERPEGQWRKLFAQAGFEITRILPMKAAESLIEARVKKS